MKRRDVEAKVAEQCGLTRAVVGDVFDKMLKLFEEAVANGESVKFQPYFHIQVRETKAMRRRNPQTGVPFDVPAGRKLKLVAGKRLADALER